MGDFLNFTLHFDISEKTRFLSMSEWTLQAGGRTSSEVNEEYNYIETGDVSLLNISMKNKIAFILGTLLETRLIEFCKHFILKDFHWI